jgi:general stress protein 26
MDSETLQTEKLRTLIKGIPFAMLTTQGTDGLLHGRPMVSQDDDDDACLWFFTDSTTHKVSDIEAHPHVQVSYSDQASQVFVSISGKVIIVTDPEVMAERWRPEYAKWIPLELGDPNLVLLKVSVEGFDYWKQSAACLGRTVSCEKGEK